MSTVTVQIDGVGKVELDGSFRNLSPAEQQHTVEEIAAEAGGEPAPSATPRHTGGLTPRASFGGDNPDGIVDTKMATISKRLGVGIDDPLTPAQLQAFRDAYNLTEGSRTNNVGNLKNPSGNGFQSYPTREAGIAALDAQLQRNFGRGQNTIRLLIDGYPEGQPPVAPSSASAPNVATGHLSQADEAAYQSMLHTASAEDLLAFLKQHGADSADPQGLRDWVSQRDAGKPVSETISYRDDGKTPAPKPVQPQAPHVDQTSRSQAFGLGALDGATFGFDDEIGSGLAAVIPGIGKRSVWDGSSLSDAYDANVGAYRGDKDAAFNEHPGFYVAGGLTSGLLPFGAASEAVTAGRGLVGAAKAFHAGEDITDASRMAQLVAKAKGGAVSGAVYGAGSDTGGLTDRLDGAATGAAMGAGTALGLSAAGRTLSPVAEKLVPKLAQSRFEARQAMNRYSATDATVSRDVDKIVQVVRDSSGNGARRKLTKGQQQSLLSRLDDLEASYLPTADVKALDLAPSVKARLNAAMAKRHILSDDDVAALADGSTAGEAVAEGIQKARRLRALVSDAPTSGGQALVERLGGIAGSKLGGPIGGAIGSAAVRALGRSQEKSAAQQAMELAAKAPKFAKMPGEAGNALTDPSAIDRLSQAASEARDAPFLAKQAQAAETQALEAEGRKASIANDKDNVRPGGGWRGYVYDQTGLLPADQDAGALKALNDGAISQAQFNAFLRNPEKLMTGKAGLALVDRLGQMAETGKLSRDPNWRPQVAASSLGVSETGKTIRNPLAYAATAKGNQQRVSDALQAVHSDATLKDAEREILAGAVTAIGNTGSKTKAQAIVADALDKLDNGKRDYARSVLLPLAGQVKK